MSNNISEKKHKSSSAKNMHNQVFELEPKTKKNKDSKKNSEAIEKHIDSFLNSGGQIKEIPSGVSGKPSLSVKRLLTISEKAPDFSGVNAANKKATVNRQRQPEEVDS